MAGSGDSGRMRSVRVECYVRRYHVYRGLPGPRLGFLLGGSAAGVQQIGSGSSTRSKKLVILAAIALLRSFQTWEHVLGIFSNLCVTFCNFSDKYFLILRHLEKWLLFSWRKFRAPTVIVIDIFVINYQLQVPCCAGDFGICSEGFQSSLNNVVGRKVPTAAQQLWKPVTVLTVEEYWQGLLI